MTSIARELAERVERGVGEIRSRSDVVVRPTSDEKFGDYQWNGAMSLARSIGKKPRDVAEAVVSRLRTDDICRKIEIAGPGFVNFYLNHDYVAKWLSRIPEPGSDGSVRLGLLPVSSPETVVVDFSSPNLAKEMHVGHLRSTVIGDCIARILEFAGHRVIRENHVGDWGTQFGMLLAHLRRTRPEIMDRPGELEIRDLEAFYVEAKSRFDTDDEFKAEARETVVALQQGDNATRRIWKSFCDESLRHCHAIYRRLGVRLIDRGESFYTGRMDEVIRRLEAMIGTRDDRLVRISEGALCMFLPGYTTREGDPLPLIVRKSDGGFNYATSDLATVLHRVEELGARRILYVVGLAQKQHFEMLFAAVRQAGWVPSEVELVHVGFGNMLSSAGTPFKTREGGTIKLKDLLDEAVARARRVIESAEARDGETVRSLSPQEVDEVAERVGLAAIKYFDLSHALNSDYRFDWDTMLSLDGNTAPYMLYAYARVRSIGRKAGVDFEAWRPTVPVTLAHPTEVALGIKLAQFVETYETALAEYRPNVLTDYLYELSKAFSRFYDKKLGVRVIDASPENVRESRLRLCELTGRTLHLGLSLLGIETVEKM
jgi:arginyl-tRNA synthetase